MGLQRFFFPSSKPGIGLNGDGDEGEKETFIPQHQLAGSHKWSRRRKLGLCLVVVGGIVLLLTITLLAGNRYFRVSSSFEPGWLTEIGTTTSEAAVLNE